MGHTMKFGLVAALAALAAVAAPAADAATSVHIDVALPGAVQPHRAPVRVVQPVDQVVPVQQVHGHPRYGQAQYGHYQRAVPVQQACGAPRWDPHVRYMPGDVVWRRGSLWMAKGVSARVWNENSPPEWTPRYWTQAACR